MRNLQQHVPPSIIEALQASVRVRGMRPWLNHEVIARGTFNAGFTSGCGANSMWAEQLTNLPDLVLAFRLKVVSIICNIFGLISGHVATRS